MTGQQDDKQIPIEFPDLRNHLVTADGGHQKVKQQDIKVTVTDPINGNLRVIFCFYMKSGTLEIILYGISNDRIIIHCQDGDVVLLDQLFTTSHFLSPLLSAAAGLMWTSSRGMEMPIMHPPSSRFLPHIVPLNLLRITALDM